MSKRICPECGGRKDFYSAKCPRCSGVRGSLSHRFWARVNKDGPVVRVELGPCWVFRSVTECGYGRLRVDGDRSKAYAHRVSWELHNSTVPDEMFVLHRCDNKGCVNPDHLFLGTLDDNNRDRNQKGRQAKGESQGRHKITAEQAGEIKRRAATERHADLAKEFGLGRSTVGHIATGRSWRV